MLKIASLSSSSRKFEWQIFVKFNTSKADFPSDCLRHQLCAPIIIQDKIGSSHTFYWKILSTTCTYEPKWSWETRSLHYNMSSYCCPSDAKGFAANSQVPVRVNIYFNADITGSGNIVLNSNKYLIEPLFSCNPPSTLEINITYPSTASQSLSYINASGSNLSCFSKDYTRNGITYVPYLSPIQCRLRPHCSKIDGREWTPCADERIEHNVRIQATSKNCKDQLKDSSWRYLVKGIPMRVAGNDNFKYFIWSDKVPKKLYQDRCLITFRAVISYPESPNWNTTQCVLGKEISVAYNCSDRDCYPAGAVRCNKATQQCDCQSACTGLGSYNGDSCQKLPWCQQTTTFVGIGVGCFISGALSITICVCNRARIRRNCSCLNFQNHKDSQGETRRESH